MAFRTKAQEEYDRWKKLMQDNGATVDHHKDDYTMLNLLHLPVETRFNVVTLGDFNIIHDKLHVKVHDHARTGFLQESRLTGARLERYILRTQPAAMHQNGADVRLGLSKIGSRYREYISIHPCGMNKDLMWRMVQEVMHNPTGGRDFSTTSVMLPHPHYGHMVLPNSIRFPAKFLNRKEVDFSGLPRHTFFATKNGGIFQIVNRSHVAKAFVVRAMNKEAAEAAEKCKLRHHTGYRAVPYNLLLGKPKYEIMTDSIRIPFKTAIETLYDTSDHMSFEYHGKFDNPQTADDYQKILDAMKASKLPPIDHEASLEAWLYG